MKSNRLKSMLDAGTPAYGPTCTLGTPETVEIACQAGFDWVFIDGQHGAFSRGAIRESIRAAQTTDVTPIVRPSASNGPGEIEWILDQGAEGIVCPMVNTAAEAKQIVRSSYYAPKGCRSVGAGRCVTHFGSDYRQRANDALLVVVMIEHVEAVENIDQIVAVEGISGVKIGISDLTSSLGYSFEDIAQGNVPGLEDAVQRVAQATLAAGKIPGIFCLNAEDALRRVEQGFRLVSIDYEFDMIRRAMRDIVRQVKGGKPVGV